MIKRPWVITILLVVLAFVLRFYHFENNSPFDWDQDRDYGEVIKIASGKIVTLGPVAKGDGGFYLGSLYYYILYPAYFLMKGRLSALPFTSLTIDAIFAGLIYLLLHKLVGKKVSLTIAIIWTFSWFAIGASRISWNIALVPLWSLLTMYGLVQSIGTKSVKYFYLVGLLAGLSVHIHVAAIPVIPILLVIFFRNLNFFWVQWLKMIIFALIPVSTLIAFDLTHSFQNSHLLRNQITYQTVVQTPIIPMITMTFIKLGKVVSGLLFSKFSDNFFLGITIFILALKSFIFDKRTYLKIAGSSVLIAIILVIALHDYGFPEYYFAPVYLSAYLIVITYFVDFLNYFGGIGKLAQYLVLAFILILNIRMYTTDPSGFSLKVKNDIVDSISHYKEPIDISYKFDPGRDGGLRYLVKLKNIRLDPKSKTRILLTDKFNTPLYIDGELARDITEIGKIKTAVYIVQ